MYAGTLVMASGAQAGLSASTQSTSFPLLLHTIIIMGVVSSFVASALHRSVSAVGFFVMAVGVQALIVGQALGASTEWLFPADLASLEETSIAVLCAWLIAGFCFMIGSEYGVLFVSVSGMAVLGVLGTVNLNVDFLVAFWVYVLGIIFTWGYQHLLNMAGNAGDPVNVPGLWRHWIRWHLSASALLTALLIIVATVGGGALYNISPDLFGRMSAQVRNLDINLGSASYFSYGGDEFRVGNGPVNLPQTPVFTVKADYPALWRRQVFDVYTERNWTKSDDTFRTMNRLGRLRYAIPRPQSTSEGTINHQMFVCAGSVSSFLPAASHAAEIQLYSTAANSAGRSGTSAHAVEADTSGSLHVSPAWTSVGYWGDRAIELSNHYDVISIMPPTDATSLRNRGNNYAPQIVEKYVRQVPMTPQVKLSTLVNTTVANLDDPYDRVIALKKMIEDRCLYTLNAPAVPAGADAASYFLLNSRRGACDLFATALAVTARMAGVPARVATGFQTGEYDNVQQSIVVRQSDAHAWVEVYFPDVGWVPFDLQGATSYDTQNWYSLLTGGYTRLAVSRLLRTLLPLLALPVFAYFVITGLYDPRRWLTRMRRCILTGQAAEVMEDYARLCKAIARRADIDVSPALTRAEFLQKACTRLDAPQSLKQMLQSLNDDYYRARHGRELSNTAVRALRQRIRTMTKQISQFRPKASHGTTHK